MNDFLHKTEIHLKWLQLGFQMLGDKSIHSMLITSPDKKKGCDRKGICIKDIEVLIQMHLIHILILRFDSVCVCVSACVHMCIAV